MLIPTGTYGPIEKVEPVEKNYIIGYTAKDGNDYVAIKPDFEKEGWFNDLIQEDGLESLCKEFPYQPLKVDKASGMLVPIFSCDYNAKATNLFHIIYHMRKDKLEEQNGVFTNCIDKPSIEIQPSNFILNSDSVIDQNGGYTPNWTDAYHHETEIPQIHQTNISNFVMSKEEEQTNGHRMTNVDITINPNQSYENIPKNWHPNDYVVPQYNPALAYQQNQGYQGYGINPYFYNPSQSQTSYLPQYKSSSNYPFMSMETMEEEYARMQEREKANLEYATKMNMDIRRSNPTMLDTSNTVDFSNPESVAKMQGMYTNPYYNNLNNPNFAAPNNYQYSMSNPYQQTVNPIYNNQYQQYNPGYGTNWWSNGVDLSFMEFSDEEIKSGKGFKVRLTRKSPEDLEAPNPQFSQFGVPKKKKRVFNVKIRRVVEITKEDGTKYQVDKEEYEKNQKEEVIKEAKENELEVSLSSIKRDIRKSKWYGESYKKQILKVANELAVYDKARAICLIGSMDDPNLRRNEYEMYYKACIEKLNWYKSQEEIHPENDYRVPFRYRKTPVEIPAIKGYKAFQPYTIPMKRKFHMPDGSTIPFYEYDRTREPNQEEWQLFYEQAIYERDKDIKLMQVKKMEEYAKEQEELNKFNPYNMMDARLHEMRMEDKLKRDQYEIFRSAYGGAVSDEEFDRWWYKSNPQAIPNDRPRSEEDLIAQRKQWRSNMGQNHAYVLQNAKPIDPEQVRIYKTNKINEIIHNFDKGIMDKCTSLRDVFDNLGYLRVRVCEDNIEKQRAEAMNASLSVNRYDYTRNLYEMANPANWSNQGVNDPYYQNRPHYMDFVNSADYEERKAQFFNYCSNTQGTIPLRPIYK